MVIKNKRSVAILMALYNGEKYLQEQIDSFFNQTTDDWTLYINDDGSSDKTMDIVNDFKKTYHDKIFVLDIKPKGLGASGNFLGMLKIIDSEYYMFSDQDDVWLESKIEKCLKEIKKKESVSPEIPIIIHSDLSVVNENLKIIDKSFHHFTRVDPEKFSSFCYLAVMNTVTGCTMMFNKKTKEIVPEIKRKYMWHDWWIAIHVSKVGIIIYIKEPLILYRQHSENMIGAKNNSRFNFLKSISNFTNTLKAEYHNIKNLKYIEYGGACKYLFYKFLFHIKR